MEKMWYRDKEQDVEVYHIDPEKKVALCFSASVCQQQSGNGWFTVKLGKLIPYPYAETYKTGMSKTQRNKLKEMLTLTYAEWTCTDGRVFENCNEAIDHQAEIVANEEKYKEDKVNIDGKIL